MFSSFRNFRPPAVPEIMLNSRSYLQNDPKVSEEKKTPKGLKKKKLLLGGKTTKAAKNQVLVIQ